jgi:enolase
MAVIQAVYAREILDSRGMPTVECTVWLDNGISATSSAPGGTSKGKYEALELRDTNNPRMMGNGVLTAVNNINTIIGQQLIGKDPINQTEIDQLMINLDGTPNKTHLGANTMIAVSQAVMKAGAYSAGVPIYYYIQQKYQLTGFFTIPTCIFNMIDGGKHGATNLDFQEFQIVPASYMDFRAALEMADTLFQKIGETLISKGAIHSWGIGGGYAPNLYNNTDTFEILIETIKNSPYTFIQDMFFGVDIAATEFFQANKYSLKDKSQPYSSNELLDYYRNMRKLYHVFSIEDPFDDDDWATWKLLTAELGETSTIIGDALIAGNKTRMEKAIAEKACNAVLIKPNESGTISETIELIKLARSAQWQVIVSHRSGETNDDFIADFAVGVGANYTKFGPPNRGERLAKYNRLLAIYDEIAQMQTGAQQQSVATETQQDTPATLAEPPAAEPSL